MKNPVVYRGATVWCVPSLVGEYYHKFHRAAAYVRLPFMQIYVMESYVALPVQIKYSK